MVLGWRSLTEDKVVKNRVHLDLAADDADAEARRLESLGATVLPHQPNPSLIVLQDPEGNEFCIAQQPPS